MATKSGGEDDKASDDKNDGDKEEKEEGEEEEDDSSDDDDEALSGEVKFKDEEEEEAAEKWSMTWFKVKYKKHLYLIARDLNIQDDDVKMQEMLKQREWTYTVKNIEFTNKGDLGDYFLCFKLGYSFKVFKKYEMSKKDWKKRLKENPPPKEDAFGRPKPKPHRKYEWVTEGEDGTIDYTCQYVNMTTGMHKKFEQDRFERTYKGSYLDLYQQKLRIELWRSGGMWPNQAVSFHEIPLVDIASNAMFQKFDFLQADKIGTRRIASCEFDLIFQQRLNFFLVFKHWHGALKWSCFKGMAQDGGDRSNGENLQVQSHLALRVFDAKEAKYNLKKQTQKVRLSKAVRVMSMRNPKADASQGCTFHTQFSFPLSKPICITNTCKQELEQAELHAKISHQKLIGTKLLATSKIPLKGVMITGAVKGPVSTLESRDGGKLEGSIMITPTKDSKLPAQDSKTSKVEKQMYHKYLQKGEMRHREILDYPPWNYRYLVIKLKSAEAERTFAEEQMTVFFTLEWGGQCQTTREFPGYSGGEIDETLYFQIVTFDQKGRPTVLDLDHRPFVTISTWQKMASGTNRCLARTRFFLHNITGAERRKTSTCKACGCKASSTRKVEIFKRRNTFLNRISPVSIADWTYTYEPLVVRTRVFSGIIPLRPTLGSDAKAIIDLEAYFRGPQRGSYPIDVDLLEIDDKRRQENNDFPWLILRHANEQTEKQKTALCLCAGICDRMDPITQKYRRCNDAYAPLRESIGACATIERKFAGYVIRTMKGSLNDLEKCLGRKCIKPRDAIRPLYYSYMCALDEDDIARFLPSYLAPITPPKEFKKFENPKLIEIAEKRDAPLMSKQAKASKAAGKKKKNDSSASSDIHTRTKRLSFPQTCFELLQFVKSFEFSNFRSNSARGKEDLKLARKRMFTHHCVSMNYFLNARKGSVREHAILLCNLFLGLELDAYVCIGKVATGSMKRKEWAEHCWVMTREPDDSSWYDEETRGNGAAVRFWELTNGKVYTLPSRCSKILERARKKVRRGVETGSKRSDLGQSSKIEEESFYKFIEEKERDLDLVDAECRNQSNAIFVEGVGMGDGVGAGTELKRMEEDLHAGALMRSRDTQASKRKEELENTSWLSVTKWHRNMLRRIKKKRVGTPKHFPYKEIYAVFNHKNYWVNFHRKDMDKPQEGVQRDPALITYDMGGDYQSNRDWIPFKTSQRGAGLGRPFFTPRSLTAAPAPDYIAQLEQRITQELTEGICNMRINIGASTSMAPKMAPLIQDLLTQRDMLEKMDKNEHNGWDGTAGEWSRSKFPKSEGVRRQKRYNEALKRLVDARLPNYKFRIKMSTLHTADPLLIRKIALDGATPTELAIYLHGTSYDRDKRKQIDNVSAHDSDNRQIFAIGVKMFGLYNGVVKTRIGVMVIWPEKMEIGDAAESGTADTMNPEKSESTKVVNSDEKDGTDDGDYDDDDYDDDDDDDEY